MRGGISQVQGFKLETEFFRGNRQLHDVAWALPLPEPSPDERNLSVPVAFVTS